MMDRMNELKYCDTSIFYRDFLKTKAGVALTAIFYTFLWGCAFPIVKICMTSFGISDTENMSKCLVAAIRFIFSGIIILIFCHKTGDKKGTEGMFKYAVLYGILGTALQYSFTYIGLSHIDASKGAAFDQLAVFIIILSSGLFITGDRLNIKKIIGCILGVGGIVILNLSGLNFEFTVKGEGFMVIASVCNAVAYFIAKGVAGKTSVPFLVGYGQLIGGILLFVISFAAGGRIVTINLAAIISLIALVLISAIAYVLSLIPLKHYPASEVASFNLLITVFGVIMSALFLGENILKWSYIISFVLISSGILIINYKWRK